MTDATNQIEWFFTAGGQRKGPVTADELRALLTSKSIDGDTPIWRKGLADWQPLRLSEIGATSAEEPPPVAASQINIGFVWTLAVAPIAYLFIEVTIRSYQLGRPWEDHSFLTALIWIIPAASNAILCLLDENQLKRAGYSPGWMTLFALLLAPVYLFLRAQRLRQRPAYGFVWIACFIASIVLRGA
jgi:hypothetical protein